MEVRGVVSTRISLGHPSTSAHLGEERGVSTVRAVLRDAGTVTRARARVNPRARPASDARAIGVTGHRVEMRFALAGHVLGHA